LNIPIYKERAVTAKWKWPYWEKVANFKVTDHFVEHKEEIDDAKMNDFLSKEMSTCMSDSFTPKK
jgi:hypothetical protein